jgi:hypothetical protein
MTTNFFPPLFCCCFWIRDPRSGMGKKIRNLTQVESQLRDIGYSTHTDNFMAPATLDMRVYNTSIWGPRHFTPSIKYQESTIIFERYLAKNEMFAKNTRIIAFETKFLNCENSFLNGLTLMSPARKYLQDIHFSCYIKKISLKHYFTRRTKSILR